MTITQTVEIPAEGKRTIDVPREVPVNEAAASHECHICARKIDPATGNPRYNAETAAAIEEGRSMMRGEVSAKWFTSLDEMLEDITKDDPDEEHPCDD